MCIKHLTKVIWQCLFDNHKIFPILDRENYRLGSTMESESESIQTYPELNSRSANRGRRGVILTSKRPLIVFSRGVTVKEIRS